MDTRSVLRGQDTCVVAADAVIDNVDEQLDRLASADAQMLRTNSANDFATWNDRASGREGSGRSDRHQTMVGSKMKLCATPSRRLAWRRTR